MVEMSSALAESTRTGISPPPRPSVWGVTNLSIVRVEGSPALQLERVGIEADTWTVKDIDHPTRTLELRQGRVCPPGLATLDAVWVRYTVLGTRQEQRIPLERRPSVRCP
jgi:hypothetical protein